MESDWNPTDPGHLRESNFTGYPNLTIADLECSTVNLTGNCTQIVLPNYDVNILLPVVSYSILFVIGAYGNVTVFVTLLRAHRKSRISLMITHLTVADLLVTFIMIPMEIIWRITNEWRAGNAACKIFLMLRAFGLYLSSNVLVCVSMDRYFAILHPLKVNDARHRSKSMLAVAWIFSFVCAFPQSIVFHVEQHPILPDYYQCVSFGFFANETQEMLYNIFCVAAMYFIPLVVIVFAYSCILWEITNKSRESVEDNKSGRSLESTAGRIRLRKSDMSTIARAKARTLRMTITIVVAFILCWTPYAVITLWYMFDRPSAEQVDKRVQEILFIMAVSNSCMNPMVYGSYAMNFKKDCPCLRASSKSHLNRRSTISGGRPDTINHVQMDHPSAENILLRVHRRFLLLAKDTS